jgi:maltooligosyltrehalose trehalohydrolase
MTPWGPRLLSPDLTEFRLWAPDGGDIWLESGNGQRVPLAIGSDGWRRCTAPLGAGARYRFLLEDGAAVPDPASRAQDGGVHGWSLVPDPASYQWQAADWRGRPWHETVIQEVHVGALGGFRGVTDHLLAMAELGITAIELMPIGAFAGTRNWGYDGVLPFAPAESYGTPDELKALVDRAHGLGLMVFLDVVYNHFGPDGNYLGAYVGRFFHPEVHTPWGGAVAVDLPPVAAFFRENAKMWLEEYRFDGLRLDAVHAIADNVFLDRLAQDLRTDLPGRHIHLVLENEANDADRLAPGLYDAQWNDDFHNVLHVLLTGETQAYYADFAGSPAQMLARCLAEGFIYQGQASDNQGGSPRGMPSGHLPPSAFVTFLQNHDQIGNRAFGERLTTLVDRDRLRAATLLLLLCPQIPLMFMGDETGSESPFLFFTDFHDELADAVRQGRRREFAKFAAFADPAARETIPDPNDPATFARSRPEQGPDAAQWRELYRALLNVRHQRIIPHLQGAMSLGAQALADAAVSARWLLGDGSILTLGINLGDCAVTFAEPAGEHLFALGNRGAPASAFAELG